MTNGLVVGKFYPPHRGHRHLIDTALSQVDHLTVLVCDRPDQRIPAEQRANWLREIHPTADVRVIPDPGHDDDSKFWADYTISVLGQAPDVVFTSEEYGEPYARYLGCRHVLVDLPRTTVPISATKVRRDPAAAWSYLESSVRSGLVQRICVLGAESTGTTTLAQMLAERYQTTWVPEYGREYSEEKYRDTPNPKWTSDEFVFIAGEQQRREDEAARRANRLLICDTNAFATGIWHERYMGFRSEVVERIGRAHQPSLYLLTDDTIPFVQDGLRDGEHLRHWMHGLFQERLRAQSTPWVLVTGDRQQRLQQAVEAITTMSLHVFPECARVSNP